MSIRDVFWSASPRKGRDRRARLRALERLEARVVLSGSSLHPSLFDVPDAPVQELAPLSFEPNVGQAAPEVDYLARGIDYSLSLRSGGAILNLSAVMDTSPETLDSDSDTDSLDLLSRAYIRAVVETQWVGANPDAKATGLQQQPGVTNYLFGEEHTYTDITNWSKVRYGDVYPGIDLVYYGREGEIEYDWVVSPGADPAQIVMGFDGVQQLSVDAHGRLVLETAAGILYQQAPLIYQDIAGERQSVEGRYKLLESDEVRFQLGTYDPAHTLVIDPVLVYSSYLGGGPAGAGFGNDSATGIAVDDEGNSYITGSTDAIDFPTLDSLLSQHPDAHPAFSPGPVAFVTKLDPAGAMVYSTYVGRSFPDNRHTLNLDSFDIAVDRDGAAYIVGSFRELTTSREKFDTEVCDANGKCERVPYRDLGFKAPLYYEKVKEQKAGAFAAKLAPDGKSLGYSDGITLFGTGETAVPFPVLDSLPTSPHVKYAPLTYATAIVVNDKGNAYITGSTNTVDFPYAASITEPSPDPDIESFFPFQASNGAAEAECLAKPADSQCLGMDGFVVRLDANGTLDGATYLGGLLNDYGKDIVLDRDGNVVVVGSTSSDNFPGDSRQRNRREDGFLAVLNSALSDRLFSTTIGGPGHDVITGISVWDHPDGGLHFYVAGNTNSRSHFKVLDATFPNEDPTLPQGFQQQHAGPLFEPKHFETLEEFEVVSRLRTFGVDGFVARLDLSEEMPRYFTYLGGAEADLIWDIDVDASGNAYVAGQTISPDFPSLDSNPAMRGKFIDAFATKLRPGGSDLGYSVVFGGTSTDVAGAIAADQSGSVHVAGWTSNKVCVDKTKPTRPLLPNVDCPPEGSPLATTAYTDGDFPTQNAFQSKFGGGSPRFTSSHPKDAFVAKFAERGFLSGISQNLHAGVPFTGRVALFYSPRFDAQPGDFVASIDWGDGSPPANADGIFQVNDHLWAVTGTHEYEEPGAYPILVSATDTTQHVFDPGNGANLLDPALNANVSRQEGQQAEPTIAIDPRDALRIFVAASDERGLQKATDGEGGGIFAAYSTDGGRTWTSQLLAGGSGDLPAAAAHPFATFDQFGNLFLTYVGADFNNIVVLLSKDGGATFVTIDNHPVGSPGLPPDGQPLRDHPVLATGPSGGAPGSLWVAFQDRVSGSIEVIGRQVNGFGAIAPVPTTHEVIPGGGRAADVEVGPDGQVLVIWEAPPVDGVKKIFANLDPDGLGTDEALLPKVSVASSHVESDGTFPALPSGRMSVEANMAWDRSGGPNNNTVYVAYTGLTFHCDEQDPLPASFDRAFTSICITSSSDHGATWSLPVEVNDFLDDRTPSRFFPSVAVNQDNGVLAVGWYDTVDDVEFGGTKTRFHVATSNDGGKTFRGRPVSVGTSDATDMRLNQFGGLGFGDHSAILFDPEFGVLHPAWSDNSLLLSQNPDRPQFEVATASIGIMNVTQPHVSIRPLPVHATEGAPFHGPVATFIHPDPARRTSDFAAIIEWGDGSDSQATISQGGAPGSPFTVSGSHTYQDEGAYLVWVTVHDLVTDQTSVAISNISESRTHEAEGSIAIDPLNPMRVFATTVVQDSDGVSGWFSDDGGVTWTDSELGLDDVNSACCDPDVTFDRFGNLYFTYLGRVIGEDDTESNLIHVVLSVDGGRTFEPLFTATKDSSDFPKIAVGPGTNGTASSVWITYEFAGVDTQRIAVAGAPVSGLGTSNIGTFEEFVVAPPIDDGISRNFGDIAIGPQGQVLSMYPSDLYGNDPYGIYVHLDPDGLGPLPVGPPIRATSTHIFPRRAQLVPPQLERGIISGASLAWDQAKGEQGRVYLTFTDTAAKNDPDTDIFLVFSDDQGQTWDGGLLFGTGLEHVDSLDVGLISDDLKDAFLDNGIALSPAVHVSGAVVVGERWQVSDGKHKYLVTHNSVENRLDVARDRVWINAAEPGPNSQFFPSISVDSTSGNVAVGWHSAAGDLSNIKTEFRLAVSSDGGHSFSEPLTVSPGSSDATKPGMDDNARRFQYGDYTGVSFVDGIVQPIWADNSAELPDNPHSSNFEIVNARVGIAHVSGVPLVVKVNTLTVVEGSEFTEEVATFIDPDPDGGELSDYSALIDWGDGSDMEVAAIEPDGVGYRVLATHEYAEKGSYVTAVGIQGRSAISIEQGIANVDDAALTPIDHALKVVEDIAFTETISFFSDANANSTAGDFTATINWGDNSADSLGSVVFLTTTAEGNLYGVVGSHAYFDETTYTATVSISENGGATVVASSQINSGDAPISVFGQPVEIAALEGIPVGEISIAEFQVLGAIDTYTGAYSAEIDWDDGTFTFPADVSLQGNVFTVTAEHAFQDGGTLFPTVTLFDDSGGSALATIVAHVGHDVTSDVTASSSGLTFNPATNLFHGNLTVLNSGNSKFTGPFLMAFTGLPAGVGLVNKTGVTSAGDPYIESNQGILFSGQSLPTLPVQFSAAAQSDLSYALKIYAEVPDLSAAQPQQNIVMGLASSNAASTAFAAAGAAASESGMSFESNQGQTDEQVDFLARSNGYTIFLTPQEAVVRLATDAEDERETPTLEAATPADRLPRSPVVRMRYVDAHPDPIVVGVGQQPGASHYLIGNDPSEWKTGIRRYASVRYHDLYPGIDLVYYGNLGELEYDWVVDPGSDPTDIVVEFAGTEGLSLDDDGRLLVRAGADDLVLQKPVLYQTTDGEREYVPGGFTLLGQNRVAFDVGTYDHSQTLVIDPVLVYSTYLGGKSSDDGRGITVDAAGNTYVTGFTTSVDFPTLNPIQTNPPGSVAFITKLDATGLPVYSSYLGGTGVTRGYGVAVDETGHAYVVGETCSVDYPAVNAFQPTLGDPSCLDAGFLDGDGFVAKLTVDGSALEFSSYLGGAAFDGATDIAVDGLGSAYVTGLTGSSDFPVHQAIQPQRAGTQADAFVTKFAPSGSELEYSTFLGGSARDVALGIAVDSEGNAHVTGGTKSVNFPTTNAIVSMAPGSGNELNAFATKISSDGSVITYSTYLGGSDDDEGLDVAVDASGSAFITGRTASTDLMMHDPLQATNSGGVDAFVVKLDKLGDSLFATYLGGSGDDEAHGIATGPNGEVLIAGRTSSADLDMTGSIQSIHRGGTYDGFVTALSNDGQQLSFATYLGGSASDELYDIVVDQRGETLVVGSTRSIDLRTVNAAQPSLASICQSSLGCAGLPTDTFIARIAWQGSGQLVVENRAVSATEGVEFTKVVATFSDTDSDVPDDYVATIDWGDGSVSQGVVTGDGNGNFEITGSHVYDRFGTYPLTVSLLDKDGSVVRPTGAGDNGNGRYRYQVSVDTAGLSGSPGFIRLQFNPAVTSQDTGAFAELKEFITDGLPVDASQLFGGAHGSLQNKVTLQNTSLLNLFTQAFQFGTGFAFDVLVTSGGAENARPHSFGNRFAVQLVDADGVTPLVTDHPSGAAFSIDISPDGSATARAHSAANGRVAVTTTLVNEVMVADAPFEAEAVAVDAREGQEFTAIVARFSDSNSLTTPGDFTATIDWGDGLGSEGVIVEKAPGEFAVVGTHTYTKFGEYPLSVRIESLGGRTATAFGAPLAVLDIQAARPTVVPQGSRALFADINQDGLPDAIVARGFSSDQVTVLVGRGDGTFLTGQEVSAGLVPNAFAVGDFNNDGRQDVVVGGGAEKSVHVLLLAEDGTFEDPVLAGQNVGFPSSFAAADFNDDGNLDLVAALGCAPFCGDSLAVLLGNGDGTFAAPALVRAETGPRQVLVEHINDDTQPDIVVRNDIAKSVSVLLGHGDGTFAAALTTDSVSSGFFSMDLGDVDSDGNADLVLAGVDGIVVRSGNGDGTFGPGSVQAPGGNYLDVDVIDFDGDGEFDLVAADGGNQSASPYPPGGVTVVRGNGDGSFQPASRFRGPTHPNDLQLADFNGDAILDVAATEDAQRGTIGLLSVVRGDGNGRLIAPVVQVVDAAGPHTFPVLSFALSADLNRDGRDDLVSITGSTDAVPVIVQLANGDGTLGSPSVFESGGRPGAAEIADLNGDSIPDLVVAERGDTGLNKPRVVGVLLGNGDGTFSEPDTYTVITRLQPTDIAVGDVNEDGTPDMMIATRHASPLLLGEGDGSFKSPSFVSLGSFVIHKMALADFDGDGHLDIVGLEDPLTQPGRAVVFLGNGNGTFRPGKATTIGDGPADLSVGDFNGDGILDIVGANTGNLIGGTGVPSLAILLGNGDGNFQPAIENAVPGRATAVHTADFDQNGQVDIAALVQLGPDAVDDPRAVALFFNPADTTWPEPKYFHTSSRFTEAITAGDFNGDGRLDIGTANGPQSTVSIILNAVSKSGVHVANVPLDAEGTEFNPVVNVPFTTTVASFIDTNPFSTAGDFLATIEWGDDITTQGTLVAAGAGRFDVQGTHTYAATRDYALTVTVMDDGGAGATATSAAHVSNTNPPIVATGTSFSVDEDAFFAEIVATLASSPGGTVHDFAAAIQWGDGQSSPGQIVTNPVQGFDVVGRHTYDLPGDYSVGVMIRSLGGESTLVRLS